MNEQVPRTSGQSEADAQQNRKIETLEDRIKRGELWIILLTAAMTIAAFAAVYVARKQWLVSERQTGLMDRQTRLMERQMDEARIAGRAADKVTDRQLKIAESQDESLRKMAETNKALVDSSKASAGSSARIAKSAETGVLASRDSIRLDQRAWMALETIEGKIVADQTLRVSVRWTNSGKTPAVKTKGLISIRAFKAGVEPDMSFVNVEGLPSTGLVAPNQHFRQNTTFTDIRDGVRVLYKFSAAEIDAFKAGKMFMYAYGRVTYDDMFGCHHWVRYCWVYAATSDEWHICENGNDMDEKSNCR